MNKEQTEKSEAFIHIREDGSVRISGGLIFCKPPAILNNTLVSTNHIIENNYFYVELPRWWELRKWIKLIRLLHLYADPVDTKEKLKSH
jgi:hypothetical protein